MAIEVHRPSRIRFRSGAVARASRSHLVPAGIASAGRLLLVGIAVGVLVMTGTGLASLAFLGVIALGAALASWDR